MIGARAIRAPIPIMKCLQNYIGIQYTGAPTPDSGLYVNQLPGVSLKAIDFTANEDKINFIGVWNDCQTRSLKKLTTAIVNYFSKRYRVRTVHESIQLPNAYLGSDAISNSTPKGANYRGFTYDLGYSASPMAKIHIEELQIYVQASDLPITNIPVSIYQVIDNKNANLLDDSIVFTNIVAGWNTVKVSKNYNAWKIFVGYDATNVNSIWMPLNRAYDMFNQQSLIQWPINSPCQAWLFGASSDNPYNNLIEMNNTYGLSGLISTRCDFDSIVCARKKDFETALLYSLGSELLIERLYSDRLNRYTTIDYKKAEKLQQYLQEQSDKELYTIIDGIDLVSWDCCLNCDAQVQLVHNLP